MARYLITAILFLSLSASAGKRKRSEAYRNQHATAMMDSIIQGKAALTIDSLLNLSLDKMTMVSSGQVSPYTTIKIDSCDFDLVMSGRDTMYLSTNDKKFQTPEGYKVGTDISALPKDIKNGLTKEPGWGYYCKLPSGWALGFCIGNSCTDHDPEADAEVKWVFKRR